MEEEEKASPDYIGHFVRFIILGWSLSVRLLDTWKKLGLTLSLLASWGISQAVMEYQSKVKMATKKNQL